jgi:hypothetical protein
MAILKGPIQFDGSIGNLRSYYDSDLKKQVVSTKGGASKQHIKNNPKLWRQDAMSDEFGASSAWAKIIRTETWEQDDLKKGRNHGKLTAIGRRLQEMNAKDKYGFRGIESSKFNFPLIGYSMNNKHPFKDVFCVNPDISITEDRREVTLELNNFRSHLKFKWPERVFYYRVYLTIFELPDFEWDEIGKIYRLVYPKISLANKTTVSDWINVSTDTIDFQIKAAFDEGHLPRERTTVVVSMGLEFASGMQHNTAFVVRDHGTTMIVACY